MLPRPGKFPLLSPLMHAHNVLTTPRTGLHCTAVRHRAGNGF